VTEHLLTPSKVTAWLDCDHYLTLRRRVDARLLEVQPTHLGDFARLLLEKGRQHEIECLEKYRHEGRSIYEVPAQQPGEPFADWVARVGTPWENGFDVIYQMPLLHDGMRGIADFLVKVDKPVPGSCRYEPLDAKLARVEAKPGHVLQLSFYADALYAATGAAPEHLHLWLGSGRVESLLTKDFRPYWRRLRKQLQRFMEEDGPEVTTEPEPCLHCAFCEFAGECDRQWRNEDSLVFVAAIRQTDRWALENSEVDTLADLADLSESVAGVRPERLERLVTQAVLQVEARNEPETVVPFQLIPSSQDPTWGRGLEMLPRPDVGDVFLDFEGDPFWKPDEGLFFLFGFIAQDSSNTSAYDARWSHDLAEEEQAIGDLIGYLRNRKVSHPGMHVYHYNHTERSALERLASEHGIGEAVLAELIETGLFVDLYPVVRNAVQVGTESYGLKAMERLAGYERGHEIDQGSGAVVEYERYMVTRDPSILERIAAYNEDDVRATLALRDWLVGRRPQGLPWRAARLDPEEGRPELEAQIEALHAFGPGTPEHLLGDLLGYWVREWRANKAPKVAATLLDTPTLLDNPEVIAGLQFLGIEARVGAKGKEITPGARFRWPAQDIADDVKQDASVLYGTPDGPTGYTTVAELDETNQEILLVWNKRAQELGVTPSAVALDDWVSPNPKPAALDALAASLLLDPTGLTPPNPPSIALLRRDLPVFASHGGPHAGAFSDDLAGMTEWAKALSGSYLTIQGPPGTGKTYWGAHIVHSLITAGRRVGITAMSHHAIDNLLEEILAVFEDKGDSTELRAVRKPAKRPDTPLPDVTYVTANPPCARSEFNLVAGTTWLFAGKEMGNAPVDVLIIDEAGQLALADTLSASVSAKNVVLLGDPLQLPQVSQAVHPGDGGLSVLEHVLGEYVTLPTDRGVFLTETRRMHPDVCRFISEEIYEGRLQSHPSCAIQDTAFGTGLRWLRCDHTDCATESLQEAQIVAEEIRRLLGSSWVNQHGIKAPLTASDFMVVAPYNDQVTLLRAVLDAHASTNGVPVGTVDKFQGREAAVVFFTMTTSSSDCMPRSPEFLFSRNRLNVAVSRARCLAYLVCTEALLNSRARSLEEMRLMSTLCSFVEYCQE
jgi:predicted RecB family nuclease